MLEVHFLCNSAYALEWGPFWDPDGFHAVGVQGSGEIQPV